MQKKKIKYSTYNFSVLNMVKKFQKQKLITKKEKGKDAFLKVVKVLSDYNSDLLFKTMDGNIFTEEYSWLYHSSRHVIFPESSELLYKIQSAKYDMKNAVIVPPFSSFMLVFPRDFNLMGEHPSGCLVSINDIKTYKRLFNRMLEGLGKDPVLGWEDPSGKIYSDEELVININYFMPPNLIKEEPVTGVSKAEIPYRISVKLSMIPDILMCETIDEYYETVGTLEIKDSLVYGLDEMESRYQFELFKVVIGMLVYIQATNKELLVSGMPSNFKYFDPIIEQRTFDGLKVTEPSNAFIGRHIKENGASRKEHLRSWVIRTLKHDKYYRTDDWKDKPKGSRLSFVPECWVGGKIDPKTLKK